MAASETGSIGFDNLVLSDAAALTDLRTLESGTVVRGQLLKLGTGTKVVAMDEYDADTDALTVAATDASGSNVSISVFTFAQLSIAAVEAVSTGVTVSEAMRNQLWLRGIHMRDTLSLS